MVWIVGYSRNLVSKEWTRCRSGLTVWCDSARLSAAETESTLEVVAGRLTTWHSDAGIAATATTDPVLVLRGLSGFASVARRSGDA